MKGKRLISIFSGMSLGLCAAAGSVGSLVTAFDLPLEAPMGLLVGGVLLAFLCALAFQWKRGWLALLCPLALLAGYVWRRGFPVEPFLSLVSRLTEVYDRAYGWGVFPATEAALDIPMACVGAVIILVVTRSVCRGTGAALPMLTAVLLFTPCIVVTDTVPALPWLFALAAALGLLVITAGVRKTDPFQGDRLAAMAAIPMLLAVGLLFRLNPKETYVNQSKYLQKVMVDWTAQLPALWETTAAGLSGQGEAAAQVKLSTLGRRIERKVTVMEVISEAGGILYLRSRDYDSYDGFGWISTRNRTEEFYQTGRVKDVVTVRTRKTETLLYLPYYPTEAVQLVGGTASNTDGRQEYAFSLSTLPDAVIREDEGEIVAGVGSAEEPDLQRYLTLPIETEAGLRAVLNAIAPSGTREDTANAIAQYVRSSAKYDLNPSRMPQEATDFVRWFLKDAERGYCVHFATAATVLLRAADIPARYVTGYMVTTEAGEAAKVTGENAHAWAEYYDNTRKGWVVLEATPPDEPEEAPSTAGTEATETPELPTRETQPTPTEREEQPPEESTVPAATNPAAGKGLDLSWLSTLAKWLLGLAGLALILEAQRQLRLRILRRSPEAPNARALARWRETALLAKLLAEDPPRELYRLAQKAKFSQHTLTVEELSSFDNYLRTARRRLKQLPWYKRLAHQYIFAVY